MADRTDGFRGGPSAVLFLLLLVSPAAFAAPLPSGSTPEPLKTWVPWVLHGAGDKVCPYAYNDGELLALPPYTSGLLAQGVN